MSAFGKIAGQLSAGVRREFLSPSKVRLTLSWGFPYEAFGPAATVKPWHVLNLVESGRALSFNRLPQAPDETPFLRCEELYTKHAIFQGSVRLHVSREMYDITLPKTPLVLETELVYVGKSTMNLHTDVLLPSSALRLAWCEVQSVLVDRASRRPAPHPQWWRHQFACYSRPDRQLKVKVEDGPQQEGAGRQGPGDGEARTEQRQGELDSVAKDCGHGKGDHPARTLTAAAQKGRASHLNDDDLSVGTGFTTSELPAKTGVTTTSELPVGTEVTTYDLRVSPSDCDAYGHANWTSYLRLCLDALSLGVEPEASARLKLLALKSADLSYIREGDVGQDIRVKFWRDRLTPGGVHFHLVAKETGLPVTYAFLQFYASRDVSLNESKL